MLISLYSLSLLSQSSESLTSNSSVTVPLITNLYQCKTQESLKLRDNPPSPLSSETSRSCSEALCTYWVICKQPREGSIGDLPDTGSGDCLLGYTRLHILKWQQLHTDTFFQAPAHSGFHLYVLGSYSSPLKIKGYDWICVIFWPFTKSVDITLNGKIYETNLFYSQLVKHHWNNPKLYPRHRLLVSAIYLNNTPVIKSLSFLCFSL